MAAAGEDWQMRFSVAVQAVVGGQQIFFDVLVHLTTQIISLWGSGLVEIEYNQMSVEVILSSKHVELDQHFQAVLTLKATFSTVASVSALFKVRTNSKTNVEVRPSFGILRSKSDDDSIASLNIKYSGRPQDIEKMKIQVNWVWGEVPQKKLNYNQFSQLYDTYRRSQGRERNHMLDFNAPGFRKRCQDSLQIHEIPSSGNESDEEITQHKEQESTEPVLQEESSVPGNKGKNPKIISPVVLLLGILVAFALGLLVGMKIEPYLSSTRPESSPAQGNQGPEEPSPVIGLNRRNWEKALPDIVELQLREENL